MIHGAPEPQVSERSETPMACLCGQARPCKEVSEDSVRFLGALTLHMPAAARIAGP